MVEQTASAYLSAKTFSVEEVGFFEAAEKLLEIWFDIAPSWTSRGGLRTIPRCSRCLHTDHVQISTVYIFAQVKNCSSAQDSEVPHHQPVQK